MHRLYLAATLVLVLASCTTSSTTSQAPSASAAPSATPTAEPTQTPSPPPSPTPTPLPSASEDASAVVVTFRVGGEQEYRVLLTHEDDIAIARRLLAGDPDELATIPNGLVVRDGDGGVNIGYGWHVDPEDVEFAEVTTEVCDGLPSDVAGDPVSYQRFCPWSAEVISIEPYGG